MDNNRRERSAGDSGWLLETTGLTKRLGGKTVVADVGLRVGEGDIYGFLGPNGAGKTTTIRMLLGLAKPTRGHIKVFGRSLAKERLEILRQVGSLVEYPSYYGHLTGLENLEIIRRLLDAPKARIYEALATVRLEKDAGRAVRGYSLGMKQRLGIAAALLGHPRLLVLDEPTNGLDPAGIQEIRELIKSLPAQRGVTILLSSHLLSEVELMATRVGIIAAGKLVYQDDIARLKQRTAGRIRLSLSEPELARQRLLSRGYDALPDERGITVPAGDDRMIAAAVADLVRESHQIYRVEEQRSSLESVFLEITGTGGSL